MRPALSADGRRLAFATRDGNRTLLCVRDRKSGKLQVLQRPVQRDNHQGLRRFDFLPGYAFLPGGHALVLAAEGKFWRVDLAPERWTRIPFTADVEFVHASPTHRAARWERDSLVVRRVEDPALSPDARSLVFSAVNRLWFADASGANPRRVTTDAVGEFAPAWSLDGRAVYYVALSGAKGSVRRFSLADASSVELLADSAQFDHPAPDPGGGSVYVYRYRTGAAAGELLAVPVAGGPSTRVAELPLSAGAVQFIGGRLFVYSPSRGLESMLPDGSDRRVELRLIGRQRIGDAPPTRPVAAHLSPDGATLLALDQGDLFTLPLTDSVRAAKQALLFGPGASGRRVPGDGADFFSWNSAHEFTSTLGTALHASDGTLRAQIDLHLPRAKPVGITVIRNARVVTMAGAQVIPRGTVIISGDRIHAVQAGEADIPAGARVIDAEGMTLLPGLIDAHLHFDAPVRVHPDRVAGLDLSLAYGVTSVLDPAPTGWDLLTYSAVGDAGYAAFPRIFTTGPIVGSDDRLDLGGEDHIARVLRRHAAMGTDAVKEYISGDPAVRRAFAVAARELGQRTIVEGVAFDRLLLALANGYSRFEHHVDLAPLYADVATLIARSGIVYTPTLLVGYGARRPRDWFLTHLDSSEVNRLTHFLPRADLEERISAARAVKDTLPFDLSFMAAQVRKVFLAGGRVALGSHGELPGIGLHWEMQLLVRGGFTPLEALRCATLVGAEALGVGDQLGSIERGKVADLVLVGGDPLARIEDAGLVKMVIRGGVLYDARALIRVEPMVRR
jgi:hypothetical protein